MAEAATHANSQVPVETRRLDWIGRVEALVNQIAEWSQSENWPTQRQEKSITERLFGTYSVPELIIRPSGGELFVNSIGLQVSGGNGRVDLEAIPTLSRVKLIDGPGGWEIWTDSNVPLRVVWNHESFSQLVRDLLH